MGGEGLDQTGMDECEVCKPPGRVTVFPGRPGRGHGVRTLVKHSTYSDTLKGNVSE